MWKIVKISRSRRRYLWNKRQRLMQANWRILFDILSPRYDERLAEIQIINEILNKGFEEQWTTKTK